MATKANLAITQTEILEALAAIGPGNGPEEAKTVAELCEITGTTEPTIRKALLLFRKGGRLGVHRVLRQALDGSMRPVPGYTILPAKKGRR